jgi:hypothetical protein
MHRTLPRLQIAAHAVIKAPLECSAIKGGGRLKEGETAAAMATAVMVVTAKEETKAQKSMGS